MIECAAVDPRAVNEDAYERLLAASLAVLEYAARYRESLLYNRYQAGRDQIARGRKVPPYAYAIPQEQRDPVAPVELLRRLDPAAADGNSMAGSLGAARAVRPEYAYALTQDDLKGFEAFIRAGGTLVCFNNAARFAIQQLRLPVKNAVEGLKPEDFFLRGSIVEVVVDSTHPVMAGMPDKAAVFVDGSPVFETLEGFRGSVMARYPETGSPLRSGYLIGEKFLHGKAAALDAEVGAGHVVLIGFRPQWRCQPFGTFRVVFNVALYARRDSLP